MELKAIPVKNSKKVNNTTAVPSLFFLFPLSLSLPLFFLSFHLNNQDAVLLLRSLPSFPLSLHLFSLGVVFFIMLLCLICVVLQILLYVNLSFYMLVSSCWLSSINNLIWIFITFVAFIELVSLIDWHLINIVIIVIIIIVSNIIVISYLYQDFLLLEIFITKYVPSFKRMPTPIAIPSRISNFYSSWPTYEPTNSVAQHRVLCCLL